MILVFAKTELKKKKNIAIFCESIPPPLNYVCWFSEKIPFCLYRPNCAHPAIIAVQDTISLKHFIKELQGLVDKPILHISCNHGSPQHHIPFRHLLKEINSLIKIPILGLPSKHTIP